MWLGSDLSLKGSHIGSLVFSVVGSIGGRTLPRGPALREGAYVGLRIPWLAPEGVNYEGTSLGLSLSQASCLARPNTLLHDIIHDWYSENLERAGIMPDYAETEIW